MREILVNFLVCPVCKKDLTLSKIICWTQYSPEDREIHTGLLQCVSCHTEFPIINKIPRLIAQTDFNPDEVEQVNRLKALPADTPAILHETLLDEAEKLKRIAALVRMYVTPRVFPSEKIRKRVEHDIEYRVYYTAEKQKFVNTVKPFIKTPPEVILDLGGGQGGTIACFKRFFNPKISILLDLDITWAEVAKLRDHQTEIIRANAAAIPLKDNFVDLLISTSALEHIPCWRASLDEMSRISKTALIVWGPNKWFPYDWGHIDAPFVTFLPKSIGTPIAYTFHCLRGTKRSYNSIKKEMDTTFFISRRTVGGILKQKGAVYNVFADFMNHSVNTNYHYIAGNSKTFLRKHPWLLRGICNFLILLGMEPMGNLFFIKACRRP